MTTKTILIVLIAVLLLPIMANAEEAKPALAKTGEVAQDKVMPAAIQRFTHDTTDVITIRNIAEKFIPPSVRVKYNKDGYLDKVISETGAEIKYSYKFDEQGELSAIVLTGDNGFSIELRGRDDKADGSDVPPDLTHYDTPDADSDGRPDNKPPDETADNNKEEKPDNIPVGTNGKDIADLSGTKPDDNMHTNSYDTHGQDDQDGTIKLGDLYNEKSYEDPLGSLDKPKMPIVVYVPKDSLKKMAQKPVGFDFNKIKSGFDNVAEDKNTAYETYLKKTAPYYTKILNELRTYSEAMKADGIKLNIAKKGGHTGGTIDVAQRKGIDEAVQDIRAKAKGQQGAAMRYEKFIAMEKICAGEFLGPNRAIYEGRSKRAVKKVNGIVDMVIKSKLAVYMNIKNDKIEAVINLPEAKKK
ncbi:MAG: hypothetical protein PHX20_02145 [Candidatus Omnitrophica bacterium]|nr:hypothetical protein [Candidatus Omnitrophota bacterium]